MFASVSVCWYIMLLIYQYIDNSCKWYISCAQVTYGSPYTQTPSPGANVQLLKQQRKIVHAGHLAMLTWGNLDGHWHTPYTFLYSYRGWVPNNALKCLASKDKFIYQESNIGLGWNWEDLLPIFVLIEIYFIIRNVSQSCRNSLLNSQTAQQCSQSACPFLRHFLGHFFQRLLPSDTTAATKLFSSSFLSVGKPIEFG